MRPFLMLALLATTAPALAVDPQTASQPGADKDKLICRRETPVGSLIASRKVCLTKAEWTAREQDGNAAARKLVEDGTSRQSGN